MARHIVTGGAGFIGSHIADALVKGGDEVIVLDDLSTGKSENLEGIDAELRGVDLAMEPNLAGHLQGVDTVFHQAALPSVPVSIEDPERSHRANVEGTLRLLVACRSAGVRRVVYASSCAIYGDGPTLPKREDLPVRPLSPYGAQKYFGEVYMQVFWRTYGLETVSLRYFNVFGPRQDASSQYSGVIALFIPTVLESGTPVVYGDGEQSRDFIYVRDVARANLRAAAAEGVAGEVFNVASGDRTTVKETLHQIQAIVGIRTEPRFEAGRAGDIRHSQADVTQAREKLDWTPTTSLTEGLKETVDWYRGP